MEGVSERFNADLSFSFLMVDRLFWYLSILNIH